MTISTNVILGDIIVTNLQFVKIIRPVITVIVERDTLTKRKMTYLELNVLKITNAVSIH